MELSSTMRNRVPTSIVQEVLNDLKSEQIRQRNSIASIAAFEAAMNEKFTSSVVFLPTYRRIERDLKKIFPHLEEEIKEHFEGFYRPKQKGLQLELVEFGMDDVKHLIDQTMLSFKDGLRSGFEKLTGEYLRDVLGNVHRSGNATLLPSISAESLDFILTRIDDRFLPRHDKNLLISKVQTLQTQSGLAESDMVIAHFLTKLYALHDAQSDHEKDVRALVEVCNSYLVQKLMVYDNVSFTIQLRKEGGDAPIQLDSLSSGEKQIVSLFSHLYLSRTTDFFLIFDEPELSLSVPWQRKFLLDVSTSGRCFGFVAVTHSPFIYENDLYPFAHSIAEFAQPRTNA